MISLIIGLLIMSCGAKDVSDNYIPKYSSIQLLEKLERYYKSNSNDSLYFFLSEWNEFIPSSTDDYIRQNDTIKNLYLVFNDLYRPFKFGNYDVENYFSNKNKYIVIQGDIEYSVYS